MPDTDGAINTETTSDNAAGPVQESTRPAGPKQAVNIQFKNVKLYGSHFGIINRSAGSPVLATVRKKAADVAAEVQDYVRPGCFVHAATALSQEHLLVLGGPTGTGKATAALALLYEVMQCDVVPIQPAITLDELRAFEYEEGAGYVVVGHASTDHRPDAEFQWTNLRDVVRHAKARLVITTTGVVSYVRQVTWQQPDKLLLLRQLLRGLSTGNEIAENLANQVPPEWTMTDLVSCGRQVVENPDRPEDALKVFDVATISEVQAWFDLPRDRRDVVEVTALAFASGASERRFESLVAGLTEVLARHAPANEAKESTGSDAIGQRRKARREGTSLIHVERITIDSVPGQVLVFKSSQHWLRVLFELWSRYEVPFWDAVREWLHDLIEDGKVAGGLMAPVAEGLAFLAQVDFDEALASFLEPLSSGEVGPDGMICAASALCVISQDDALAPITLQTAVRWIQQGDEFQRMTASWALMADIGVRFPAEAGRRLWQYISQNHHAVEDAVYAPAVLLANLLDAGSNAADLLDLLDGLVTRFSRRGTELRVVDLILNTALGVLTINHDQTRHLVIFDLLATHPDRADVVARIWAGVLRNRRGFRLRALDAIWDGLHASQDPQRAADTLGEALFSAIPTNEHDAFIRDFRNTDVRKRRRGQARAEEIANLLIKALERMHSQPAKED